MRDIRILQTADNLQQVGKVQLAGNALLLDVPASTGRNCSHHLNMEDNYSLLVGNHNPAST